MPFTSDALVSYQRSEFAKASPLRVWLIGLQFFLALPAAASIFVDDANTVFYLAILGALLLLAWISVDIQYRNRRGASERARRASLIALGLGDPISPQELLSIREEIKSTDEEAQAFDDPAYFRTSYAKGFPRLGEMIEESAFWTSRLQKTSAFVMASLFGTCIALFFFTMAAWAPYADAGSQMAAYRLFLTFLVFLLSSDIWGSVYGHIKAARTIGNIVTRMAAAESRDYPRGDLLLLMNDYNSAVESAPMIVPGVYSARRAHLNRLWNEYHETKMASREAR